MFGHLYYTFGLIISISILSLLFVFGKYIKMREWYSKFQKVTKERPIKDNFRTKEEHDLNLSYSILSVFEFIWVILGLLTASWYIFLTLLVISFTINFIIRPIQFTLIGKIIYFKMILLRFITYLFLIINHFHLHISLWDIIKNI
jgi:hypothetical protein